MRVSAIMSKACGEVLIRVCKYQIRSFGEARPAIDFKSEGEEIGQRLPQGEVLVCGVTGYPARARRKVVSTSLRAAKASNTTGLFIMRGGLRGRRGRCGIWREFWIF